MSIELRSNRTAFRISGPDAKRLLHDVLTPPVVAEPDGTRWFALLSPQGKIAAEGLIGWADDAFWLDVDSEAAPFFAKRMAMYRLRAKADIEALGDTHTVGWAPTPPALGVVHKDPRAEGLGYRVIAPVGESAGWSAGEGFPGARIASGVSEMGSEFGADEAFPHDIGMDLLGAIDFKKGCYIGQEVVSRMQHRGTARRRPVIVEGVGAASAGETITVGGRAIGKIGRPNGGKAVAIVRIDKVDAADGAQIGEAPVELALPKWARYAFGTQGDDS